MLERIITYLQKHASSPITKWLSSYAYFFRLIIPELFFQAYKNKTQKQIIKSTEVCACSVCDNNYVPGLIILIESILEYNNWFNLPFYIFMDSDKKINHQEIPIEKVYDAHMSKLSEIFNNKKENYAMSEDQIHIGSIGRLAPVKNYEMLIRIFAIVKNKCSKNI